MEPSIQLYFDEDAMHGGLVSALRSRGMTVVTVLETGMIEMPDEEQLAFATDRKCVLYTFNIADFSRLHQEWIGQRREHAGIILAPQQRYSIGEQLRRILRLRSRVGASGMRNRIEFLSNWG